MKPFRNDRGQIKELADYLEGYADARENEKMKEAARWLNKAARNTCAGGIMGCHGGPNCSSDHK